MKMKNLLKIGLIVLTIFSNSAQARGLDYNAESSCTSISYEEQTVFNECLKNDVVFHNAFQNIHFDQNCKLENLQKFVDDMNRYKYNCVDAARILQNSKITK